jgi:phosphosulfolactate phosphohydrolase-like enzyme
VAVGLARDFECCLAFDTFDVVPLLDGDGFVAAD